MKYSLARFSQISLALLLTALTTGKSLAADAIDWQQHLERGQKAKEALPILKSKTGQDSDETAAIVLLLYNQYLNLNKRQEARALLPKYIEARKNSKRERDPLLAQMTQMLTLSMEPRQPQPLKASEPKFLTEEEWMVDFVGRDITEMLTFAALKEKPNYTLSGLTFQTKPVDRVKGIYQYVYKDEPAALEGQYQFTIDNYLWAPQNYTPLANQLLKELKLAPVTVSECPKDFIAKLADGDIKVMLLESQRVSEALTKQPLDAGLHEQAAMLIAKLNIEECASTFTEDRPQFARGCAHLSIARALTGGKLSLVGELAEVALELMTARDGMVQERLSAMSKKSQDREYLSWVRALQIRSTNDLRIFNEKDHTAVEAGQYVMRMGRERNGDASLEYVMEKISSPQMYFFRVLGVCCESVSAGHTILNKIVGMELQSFLEDYNVFNNKSATSPFEIVDQLNLTPTRAVHQTGEGKPSLKAISWDDMAAFHCRHLLAALSSEYYFYRHMYGVKEMAAKEEESTISKFGHLTKLPLLLAEHDYTEREQLVKPILVRCYELEEKCPELVTSDSWSMVKRTANRFAPDTVLRKGSDWFNPVIPRGTAFYYYARKEFGGIKDDLETLTRIRSYCPFHYEINLDWARKKYGDYPTAQQYAEAFGKMTEYNTQAQRLVAFGNVDETDEFVKQKLALAEKDPHNYFELANYMATRGKPEEAKTYFEKALAKNDNAVMNANHTEWLVFYYLKKGDKEKAKALAEQAYEVYSERGLDTMAKFYERTGETEKALKIFKEIEERYQDKRGIAAFYIRNADKNAEWKAKAAEMSKETYPDGMKKVTLTDFKNEPKEGMLVKWGDPYLRDHPITKGVIIVALNGFPVNNMNQYYLAKEVTPDGKIKAIFWDPVSKTYKEAEKQTVQDNLMQIQIEAYKPGQPELSGD